jgi:membrane fusion protein
MQEDLFRPEAIEAQQQARQTGKILLTQSIPLWALTLSTFVLIILLFLFLGFGEFTRKERVYGITIPGRGAIRLTAQESGFVHSANLYEGKRVAEGELLFEIRQDKFSDLGDTQHLIETSLQNRNDKLADEIDNRLQQEKINLSNLQTREIRLKQEIASLDVEIDLQKQQIVNTERLVKNLRPLFDEQIIPEVQYQQQVSAHLEQRARLESLRRNRLDLKASYADTLNEISASELRAQADRSTLERNILANEQTRLERRGARVSYIRAPIAGIVSNILVDVGVPVEPGRSIATILPDGVQLEAQLFIPSTAIGFLKQGQEVRLRYDAFPYQKFGLYEGELAELSNIDIPLQEIQTRFPILTKMYEGKTFFRANVRLDKQSIEAYGKSLPLRAGLTLEADVLLDRKRLIEWVFDPVMALGKRL